MTNTDDKSERVVWCIQGFPQDDPRGAWVHYTYEARDFSVWLAGDTELAVFNRFTNELDTYIKQSEWREQVTVRELLETLEAARW